MSYANTAQPFADLATDGLARPETPKARARTGELWQFRLLYAATFPLFLTAVALGRLAGERRDTGHSIFAEARQAAGMAIPFAFMR